MPGQARQWQLVKRLKSVALVDIQHCRFYWNSDRKVIGLCRVLLNYGIGKTRSRGCRRANSKQFKSISTSRNRFKSDDGIFLFGVSVFSSLFLVSFSNVPIVSRSIYIQPDVNKLCILRSFPLSYDGFIISRDKLRIVLASAARNKKSKAQGKRNGKRR